MKSEVYMTWIEDIFGVRKPILAMCHLGALPGDPALYRAKQAGRNRISD